MKGFLKMWKDTGIEEKFLYLYVIFIPFTGVTSIPLGIKRVGLPEVLFLGWIASYIAAFIRRKATFCKSKLEIPLALLVGLFFVSFLNSIDLFGSFAEMSGLVYLIALFFLTINILSKGAKLRALLNVFLAVSTGVSIVALLLFLTAIVTGRFADNPFLQYTDMEAMAHSFPRIKFTLETPNMMLSYLHVSLIIGMILFLIEKKSKVKLFLMASIILIVITAFFYRFSQVYWISFEPFLNVELVFQGEGHIYC